MEKCGILLNESYGPFRYSQWAVDNFNVRNMLRNHWAKRKTNLEEEGDTRSHPIMIQVVEELGEEAWGTDSKIVVKYVPQLFFPYVLIENYDGFEVLDYDLAAFKLDLIRQTTHAHLNDEEKMRKIEEILATEYRPWLYCD